MHADHVGLVAGLHGQPRWLPAARWLGSAARWLGPAARWLGSAARWLGPADWVTLSRALLAVAVAALVAQSLARPIPVGVLVSLAAVALVLDAVDGWVARRTGTASPFGARFDMEVDAFLILVLSAYVALSSGAWVLVIGLARYGLLAAACVLPWLRAPVTPRVWRKVVAATQGVVLAVAASGLLPVWLTTLTLAGSLALLAESFRSQVWELSCRRAVQSPWYPPAAARYAVAVEPESRGDGLG